MLVRFVIVKDISSSVPRYTVLQMVEEGRTAYAAVHEGVTMESLPAVVRATENDFSERAGRDLFSRGSVRSE